jgi:hypothetical protein
VPASPVLPSKNYFLHKKKPNSKANREIRQSPQIHIQRRRAFPQPIDIGKTLRQFEHKIQR